MRKIFLYPSLVLAAAGVVSVATVPSAQAQAGETRTYNLTAQPLARALRALALASGRNILAPATLVSDRTSRPLDGRYTVEEAVAVLLAGSGLQGRLEGTTIVIEAAQAPAANPDATLTAGEIVVTGSRIRGAGQASTVISVSGIEMENQGRSDLGSVVRALPQSFGGGQNPGIGVNVPAASGVDVGGGSSVNLRGLGSDATLTLLDGRRLAFTASRQSIDVSAIPFGAVDRIEIVPDGASAIYGSDAVAGVVNIILKRQFDGAEVGGRVASATDGGNFQQQAWATGGMDWTSGSAVLSYDYGSNDAIVGAQRSYAATKPGLTLYPALRHHSAALAGQQTVAAGLTLEVDGLFNHRTSRTTVPTMPSGDVNLGRATNDSRSRSWVFAPSLKVDLSANWQLVLAGDVGAERVDSIQTTCISATCSQTSKNFFENSTRSLELAGDGPVFALPGGDAKLAAGAGYRSIGFERFAVNGTAVNAKHRQDSYYVFGEVNLPIFSPGQEIAFIHRLTATAAVRYERYPGIGGVPTPKLGMIWSLTPDLTVKGSWGRSFKAPTQYQQYLPRAGVLYPPNLVGGGAGFPTTAGVLFFQGGNPDLKPERATTWSATFALHPRAVPGAELEISYFNVGYRDRIVAPIGFVSQALSNPLFAAQIIRNPTAAQQSAIISSLVTLINITGVAYNPANVVAIIDNANVNAGRQTARGVDILARYRIAFGAGRSLGMTANASYLESDQQISSLQPVIPLAGRIFSPPHWRGQGTLTWNSQPLTLAASVNYADGVLDARRPLPVDVAGMTTFDLTARFRVLDPPMLRRLELNVSVGNLFNAKPDVIVSPAVTDTPYDSTNYSPLGRTISVGVRGAF